MENISVIEKILLEKKVISEETLEMAKDMVEISKKTLTQAITSLDVCSELDILNIVKESLCLDIKILDLESILNILNENKIKNYQFNLTSQVSLERNQILLNYTDTEVIVLTSVLDNDKHQIDTSVFYKKHQNLKTIFVATTHYNLMLIRKRIYENFNYKEKIKSLMNDENFGDKLKDILSLIIERAVIEKASDVFINYNEDTVYDEKDDSNDSDESLIFYKIKGESNYRYMFQTKKINKLVSFVLNKSNMESGKKGGHQDGSMIVPILEGKYSICLRISTATVITGKSICIRIQDKAKELDKLGFEKDDLDFIKNDLLVKSKGIVLLVGKTGSGKTTTMYSMLNEYNPFKKRIITMEDPVEIRKYGFQQIQINKDAGQSFAQSIRTCLRQAPSVALIGEIRDAETAEHIVEIANTGHLVFATIHVSSVTQIEQRLMELGVENTKNFMENISCCIYQEMKNENNEYYLAYEMVRGNDFSKIKSYRIENKSKSTKDKDNNPSKLGFYNSNYFSNNNLNSNYYGSF